MKVKIEKLEHSRTRLTIELSQDEFEKYREKAFLRLAANTEIKGFRPGKAPRTLIEDKIGKDKIFQEALEILLPSTYFEAIKKENIIPVSDPDIQIEKYEENQPFVYKAEVDILPEFKLPDYKKLKVKSKKVKISEEDIEKALENLRKAHASYMDKNGPAEKGDKIEINFEGYLKGVKIEQLTSQNHPLILGEGGFIKGFEDELAGLKKGEEKEFSLTLPSNMRDKFLANQTVKFKVKMLLVQKVILPELNDEFAARLAKGKKLVDIKKDLAKSLQARAEYEEKRRVEVELLDKLADLADIDIPKSLIKNEQMKMISDLQRDIESRGLSFAKYLEGIGKTEQEFMEAIEKQAEKAVKIGLLIAKIKVKEKISVAKTDIDKELEIMKEAGYNIEDEEKARNNIRITLENQKIVKKLVDYATK